MAVIPSDQLERLEKAIIGAGVAITSVNIDGIVTPSNLQAAAQPTIDAFDTSGAAQTTRLNLLARALANIRCNSGTSDIDKLMRAVVSVLLDELNILRGLVIGTGSIVWDAPNLSNATGATSNNITVNGAAFGDFVDVACSISLGGLTATGYVSAANTVVIRLHNGTGGAVNLASATFNVVVRRDVALAARTLGQAKTAIVNKIDGGSVD